MNFTEVVKRRMAEKNIGHTQLAKRTGYSLPYIIDLLKGHRRWNETTMSKVAEVLEIRIEFEPIQPTGTED